MTQCTMGTDRQVTSELGEWLCTHSLGLCVHIQQTLGIYQLTSEHYRLCVAADKSLPWLSETESTLQTAVKPEPGVSATGKGAVFFEGVFRARSIHCSHYVTGNDVPFVTGIISKLDWKHHGSMLFIPVACTIKTHQMWVSWFNVSLNSLILKNYWTHLTKVVKI